MSTILFIGVGTMGSPMVHRLVGAGHDVHILDADFAQAAEVASSAGAKILGAPAEAADASFIILMLPNSEIVTAVLGDPGDPASLASNFTPGTVILDMGSSRPDATRMNAEVLAARGVSFIDAPVSGGKGLAVTGALTIMVGASDHDWARAQEVLVSLGTSITRVGDVGAAHALKALNNLLAVIGIVGAVEVLSVGVKFGLDPSVMLDVINHSTGRNHATEVKIGPHVMDRQWNVGFSLELAVKDINTALSLAAEAGIEVPVSSAAVDIASRALESFRGAPADQSHIAHYLEEFNEVSLMRRAVDKESEPPLGAETLHRRA